ncbi:ROK family protein [Martelella lutilitoris]|uniref:ROK family protein n=1 Tax=Martelella lutilitoris TaxID=2583532 RepID=A0A5C4JY80_9HYPH|nr:ROK family protein [Martelella lutilitoris]TNB49569.1 ROK family protein [Martelella lutilitoris]
MERQNQEESGASPKRRGSNQIVVRHYNERLVLQLIRRHGQLTKAEATRATTLSPNAISNIFRSLEAENLLLKGEPARGKMGQPSIPASINPDAKFYFGLKVGRRSFDLVIIDFAGEIRASESVFHDYPTPEACIGFVRAAIETLLGQAKVRKKDIAGFGVAMPGELWSWTDEVGAPAAEMNAWRTFDIAEALAALGAWRVMIENDGTAACRAELMFGPHADKHDFVYFFVGTLIGGGIVLNGSVFSGRTGNAGGFGPLRIPGGVAGKDRLMDQTSVFVLERAIAETGADPHCIWHRPASWDAFPGEVEAWVSATAKGLAAATVSSLSIIDFEAVVVDGAFPEHVRATLIDAIRTEIETMDLQGISKPSVEAGRWGSLAKAVGAAALPLAAEYSIENSPFVALS